MASDEEEPLRYQRSRFTTCLPQGRLYTASHDWLLEEEPDRWRVGLTRFATRMPGDPVEFDIEVAPVEPATIGFYFAKLWYFERLYPLIFRTGASGRALHR